MKGCLHPTPASALAFKFLNLPRSPTPYLTSTIRLESIFFLSQSYEQAQLIMAPFTAIGDLPAELMGEIIVYYVRKAGLLEAWITRGVNRKS